MPKQKAPSLAQSLKELEEDRDRLQQALNEATQDSTATIQELQQENQRLAGQLHGLKQFQAFPALEGLASEAGRLAAWTATCKVERVQFTASIGGGGVKLVVMGPNNVEVAVTSYDFSALTTLLKDAEQRKDEYHALRDQLYPFESLLGRLQGIMAKPS